MVKGWRDGESGRLGEDGVFLADLLGRALLGSIDGVLRLQTHDASGPTDAHVFLARGVPVHVSGTAVLRDFLGQILVERGQAEAAVVESAFTAQDLEAQADPARRRPLGQVLEAQAGIPRDTILAAVREQIVRRLGYLMGLRGLTWSTLRSGADVVETIAVPVEGWTVLAHLIREHASDHELAVLSDDLLGHAVRLTAPIETLTALRLTAEELDLFRHLDRPRKVHQLELVSSSRRRTRTLLKTLNAVGVLELLPAAQGMPIKELVKNVAAPSTSVPPREDGGSSRPSGSGLGTSTPPSTPLASSVPPRSEHLASARPPTPAPRRDSPVVAELRAVHARIGKVTYYELLGAKTNAPVAEIRSAYTTQAKKFHPDALGGELAPDVESMARAVASALNDAYTTLSDVEKRGKYDAGVKSGNLVPDEAGSSRAIGAKTKYEMAIVHLRRHDYVKAREALRQAMDMHPQHGLYKGTLAWATFADPAAERSEAVLKSAKMLEEAIAASPREAQLHYYLGRVLKERGDIPDATESFKQTLMLEPKHKDAATELRLLVHRRKSAAADKKDKDKGGGMLSRLLKR